MHKAVGIERKTERQYAQTIPLNFGKPQHHLIMQIIWIPGTHICGINSSHP